MAAAASVNQQCYRRCEVQLMHDAMERCLIITRRQLRASRKPGFQEYRHLTETIQMAEQALEFLKRGNE